MFLVYLAIGRSSIKERHYDFNHHVPGVELSFTEDIRVSRNADGEPIYRPRRQSMRKPRGDPYSTPFLCLDSYTEFNADSDSGRDSDYDRWYGGEYEYFENTYRAYSPPEWGD